MPPKNLNLTTIGSMFDKMLPPGLTIPKKLYNETIINLSHNSSHPQNLPA